MEEMENVILQNIYLVTLTEPVHPNDRKRLMPLETSALDLIREGKDLRLTCNLMPKILLDHLHESFNYTLSPFQYLIDCYRRANDELMAVTDENLLRSEMEAIWIKAKSIAVSYCRIGLTNPGMFGNPEENRNDFGTNLNVSPLLSLIFSHVSSDGSDSSSSECRQCPPEFFEDFFRKSIDGDLDVILQDVYDDLRRSVTMVSALGNYQWPLRALLFLLSFPTAARSLVNHPNWIPKKNLISKDHGRDIEMLSILGPFLNVSCLPDHVLYEAKPDVRVECFPNVLNRTQADYSQSFTRINTAMNNVYDGLEKVFVVLRKETGVNVLEYLIEVINRNLARSSIEANLVWCASLGMFVNLSALMLRLSVQFFDPNYAKKHKINPMFALCNRHLNLRLTEATSSGSNAPQHVKLNFNCECFFMTARVLNLGLIIALSTYEELERIIESSTSQLVGWEALPPSPHLEFIIAGYKKDLESYTHEKLCIEAQIFSDESLIQQAVLFYKFMVDWLVECVGGFKLPLPITCPMDFASIPYCFVDDAMEMLIHASRVPRVLDRVLLDGFMDFIVLFMASPKYVSLRIRGKMAKALKYLVPCRSYSGSSARYTTFEGQQPSLKYLVRSLLKLFADMKWMDLSDNLEVRHDILYVLRYLWNVPSHREAWRQIAEEEEKGAYLDFVSFLINESVDLFRSNEDEIFQEIILENMKMAIDDVRILAITTEQITAPFLLPEMVDRVTVMLNFFLLKLVGPQKKQIHGLWQEYERHSMKLIKQLVRVYVHLARVDIKNIFPVSISNTINLFLSEQLFCDAVDDLCKVKEDARTVVEFLKLSAKVNVAVSDALNAEADLGYIPEEFLDPIQYTVMKDPVILPSGNSIDRAVIERHLLNYSTDPFTNRPLTLNKLIPNTELKALIEKFLSGTRSPQHKC